MLFERMAYMEAARLYERLVKEGETDTEILKRLGDAYYQNARYAEAAQWYRRLFEQEGQQEPVYFFRYSQCLNASGEPERAEVMLKAYNELIQSSRYTQFLTDEFDRQGIFGDSRPDIELKPVGINTVESEYGATLYRGQLIFTSNREVPGAARRRFLWTNSSFTNLFASDTAGQGLYGTPREFLSEINSKFNESTPVFSQDGTIMYFTRNNLIDGKMKTDLDGLVRLKIFRAMKTEGKWGEPEELSFNSDLFSCAHPALNPAGDLLYFVSDMPGGKGSSDLYQAEIFPDGSLGIPVNLGDAINTPGRETFPFVSDQGELFFSSDGHRGLGGLDIFAATTDRGNDSIRVRNIGVPFNSPFDDFAFVLDRQTHSGFLSSNRAGGQGSDDIYQFTVTPAEEVVDTTAQKVVPEPKILTVLQGTITDTVNSKPVPEVGLVLLDAVAQVELGRTSSDENGFYRMVLPNLRYFELQTEVRTHRPQAELFDLDNIEAGKDTVFLNIELTPVQDAKVLAKINEIYFDFDSSEIRPDAAAELDKVVRLMLQDYPEMTIRIESHTDPLGSHKYNDRLSQLRAASTYNYLVSQGVPRERILSFRGFGKRRPVNDCTGLEDCRQEDLELNRRTVLPIVQISSGFRFEAEETSED